MKRYLSLGNAKSCLDSTKAEFEDLLQQLSSLEALRDQFISSFIAKNKEVSENLSSCEFKHIPVLLKDLNSVLEEKAEILKTCESVDVSVAEFMLVDLLEALIKLLWRYWTRPRDTEEKMQNRVLPLTVFEVGRLRALKLQMPLKKNSRLTDLKCRV
ncbi:MAG: hypothetical protein R2827_06345 [Bdellovibrionales bacterium]